MKKRTRIIIRFSLLAILVVGVTAWGIYSEKILNNMKWPTIVVPQSQTEMKFFASDSSFSIIIPDDFIADSLATASSDKYDEDNNDILVKSRICVFRGDSVILSISKTEFNKSSDEDTSSIPQRNIKGIEEEAIKYSKIDFSPDTINGLPAIIYQYKIVDDGEKIGDPAYLTDNHLHEFFLEDSSYMPTHIVRTTVLDDNNVYEIILSVPVHLWKDKQELCFGILNSFELSK